MEKGSASILQKPVSQDFTAQSVALAVPPKPVRPTETGGPSFLAELGRAMNAAEVTAHDTHDASALGRSQESTAADSVSNAQKPDNKSDSAASDDRTQSKTDKTDRVRDEQRDVRETADDRDDKRSDKDKADKDKSAKDGSDMRDALRADALSMLGVRRPAPTAVHPARDAKKSDDREAFSTVALHKKPAARLVKPDAQAAAVHDPKAKELDAKDVKTQDKNGADKRRVASKNESQSDKGTESFLSESLRTKSSKETAASDTVTVRLNTEKWSVHGTPSQGSGDSQGQQQEQKNQDKHAHGKDAGVKPALRRAGSELENAGRANGSPLLDTASLFREQMRANESAADNKSQSMQNHRELFNELVEKARMNFGSDGRSTAVIRMRPESLGQITLNIKMHDNQLEAKVLVDNKDAQKL
ncbi:MAG: hypothetical protein HY042_12245, partial [Spirochaetia bacterium]|nr:hypothetical protein [Spirochaetia bacterium]